MYERRNAIFVNKLRKVHPLSTVCEICNIIDGLYQCNVCQRNTCINHKKKINNESYCLICINDQELSPFLNAIYLKKNQLNFVSIVREKLIYIFSFEWIHRK